MNCEVGRRVVDRVDVEQQQQLDLPGVHRRHQIAQRLGLVDRRRRDRLGVHDRHPVGAERGVDRRRQQVDDGRLPVAGDDDAAALVRLQVAHHGGDQRLVRLHADRRPHRQAEPARDAERELGDLGRAQRLAVIRHGAGVGGRGLDHVQAVHRSAAGVDVPLAGEVLHVAHHARPAAEEVGVERQDAVGPVEAVLDVERAPEGGARRRLRVVAVDRLVAVPGRLRVLGQQLVHQPHGGRRADVAGEDAQPGALRGLLLGEQRRRRGRRSCARSAPRRRSAPPASGRDRRARAPRPAPARRWRRGWRDDRGCPRPWSDGPCGSRPAGRCRCRRAAWRWRSRAARRERCTPAPSRTGRRSRSAAWCRR